MYLVWLLFNLIIIKLFTAVIYQIDMECDPQSQSFENAGCGILLKTIGLECKSFDWGKEPLKPISV